MTASPRPLSRAERPSLHPWAVRLAGLSLMLCAPACITQGSGIPAVQARSIGGVHTPAFRAITLEGSIDAHVTIDPRISVVVRCDDNLVPLIRTDLRGEELVIDVDDRVLGISPKVPCRVDVTTPDMARLRVHGSAEARVTGASPHLAEVALSGSGNVDIASLQSDALTLDLSGSGEIRVARLDAQRVDLSTSGSGDITLGGRTAHLRVATSGSGDIEAIALSAESAEITVSGSASVRLTAHRSARARISGSGDIHVAGSPPERHGSSSGSGDITFD
ncbi:head GIN domain-containing protein [Chondromyces apiculatus]|nr:head GIN domain-containing protein [Chondromyces apiculatus]